MIFRLVWENIRFRFTRTLLSVLLIAVPVTLILTLVGLSHGFLEDSQKRAQGVGADIVVRPPQSSIMSLSGATIPDKLIGVLAKEPHVTLASGVAVQSTGGFDSITGIDPATFSQMSGGFTFLKGHSFTSPDDVLVDQYFADQHHLKAGGTVEILNHKWNVAGVVEPGKLAHVFVQLPVLQDLISATNKVSMIYLKLDRPSNTDAVVGQLKQLLADYQIYPMQELVSAISVNNVPYLATFIHVIVGIGVLIGFAVVSLSMYMAVLQRTREIAILKSLGATKGFVLNIILAEAFMMGLGGTIAGIALSFGTRWIMRITVPSSMPMAIAPDWWPIAGAIAVGAALLGALYPGMLAVSQDPIKGLAYE